MIVTDLSNSFHPVPKSSAKNVKKDTKSDTKNVKNEKKVKKNVTKNFIKKKSSKLAKLEKNRYSIVTNNLEKCYFCSSKKEDFHELIEGKNRQVSIKYGLVIPICRKCHIKVTNDKTLQEKLHKVAQKVFENEYKTENFIQIFGKSYI